MAFPKGPPKPSSGLFFWLVIAVVSSLLLLLWGWQAGMLGKAGSFLSGLISPAQYAGYGKQTADNDGTGRPALRAEEEAARHRADAERKAREEAADTATQTADKAAADKEAADKAAAEKAAADKAAAEKAEAERLAAEKAQAEKEEAERQAAAEAEKKAAEEEAARKAEVEAQKKAAAQQLAATEQTGAQAGKRRVQVAPADAGEAAVNKELAKNWPLAQLRKYFNLQEQARRLVITVDNLPREHVPSQLRVTRGVPELLRVKKEGETITLDPSNYERYDRIIGYVEKMDARKIGRLYAKFYPLLQRTYEETGFPEERFHDRVLAALDDMMDAPRPTGPIRLVQPKVLYRFEDDHLENLSAGQKIMIRVGPDNAARLRKVLARVRAAIAAHDPDEQE
ncbi:DUF3014 domain-containing protein [Lautropia mirabilis ATCC 51599]|jgi:hypothetical protein|uniref:DUF3014 domain-containing protein n=1 Tax=Lautropia mirabilis ATCC 51599 TaxID=887898 RepID=E7RZ83_9BURK|nr:DUF3014 domain-containing protein [Lautropia mirabilis]EFV93882.1 hypothetical protein HMPREF0551_1997 [Lautropia mirabilis ATCC 51599]VEH00243.1 Protein of uncharacterised function (DUF3014) [Lautropia mirabilis]